MQSDKINIDSILAFILVKKICTPINQSEAYKKNLVSSSGKVIREPQSIDDKNSLTLLDRVVFKLKRLLGGKITIFNSFLYTTVNTQNYYSKLVSRGSVEQRAEIQKLERGLKQLAESCNMTVDQMFGSLINEELNQLEDKKLLEG